MAREVREVEEVEEEEDDLVDVEAAIRHVVLRTTPVLLVASRTSTITPTKDVITILLIARGKPMDTMKWERGRIGLVDQVLFTRFQRKPDNGRHD